MSKRVVLQAVLVAFSAAALASCATPPAQEQPDLVPEPRVGSAGAEGFCRREGNNLIVRVRNQTNIDVVTQTTTNITFSPGGSVVSRQTPAIAGGSFADVQPFPIPPGCFNPDCDFTIEVDANDEVDESRGDQPDNHETNNTVQGICIG